ncbi:hypothetical protein ES708_10230 [subsurface metagenome]
MPSTEIKAKPALNIIRPEEIHHLLTPGEMGAVLEWTVHDPKTGKVTEHRVMKSRSFVKAFLQLLFVKMAMTPTTAPIVIVDTGAGAGTDRNVSTKPGKGYLFITVAAAGLVTNGIIIGTGITPPDIADHRIETLIPHATANYSAMTWAAPGADATTSQFTITRNFTAVGAITVNEIALYCQAEDTTGTMKEFMIIRDAPLDIAVGAGLTLTVNYRLQAAV